MSELTRSKFAVQESTSALDYSRRRETTKRTSDKRTVGDGKREIGSSLQLIVPGSSRASEVSLPSLRWGLLGPRTLHTVRRGESLSEARARVGRGETTIGPRDVDVPQDEEDGVPSMRIPAQTRQPQDLGYGWEHEMAIPSWG